jgi:tetratricopeptide (TPR) repeat protein
LKSINCHNGDVLAEELVSADGREKVLSALGAASTSLRKQLGESLASVEKFDAPPENVTTPSLEALHAYSLGFKVHVVSLDEAGAAVLFQRAIALDPRFAMAYARLAICYANLGEFSRAADSVSKAYELRDRASEHEKLFILSMYHEFVSGDLEAARQTYELRAQLYPHDDIPIGNLGNVYFSLGKYDKAIVATKEALRRNPGSRIWYGNLASAYIAANQLQQAKATIDEARSHQLDSTWLHLCLYLIDFQQRDAQGMEREAALLKDEPGFEDVSLYYQSQAAAYAGRLKESRTLTRHAVESARRADHVDSASFYLAEAALREALFGNTALGKRLAWEARELSHSRDTEATAGITLALSGDPVQAMRLASELGKRFPEDTDVQSRYIPMIHAAAILGDIAPSKQYDEAIKALAVSVPYEYGSESIARVGFLTCYPIYFRGQTYLTAKNGPLAAAEFQKIIDHSQLTLTDPVGALAYLGLARAYAISEDRARSRAAYDRFLTLWKNADSDLTILKQAVAEAARLPH